MNDKTHIKSLRAAYADRKARKNAGTQLAIVEKYEDQIVELITLDSASLPDVISLLREAGENVRPAGFKVAFAKKFGGVRALKRKASDENLSTSAMPFTDDADHSFFHKRLRKEGQ